MSKEQQEILDEVYENYCKSYPNVEKTFQYEGSTIDVRKMTKEEFVNECKTDSEFSEKWGLKIEEQTILEQVDQTNPILKGSTTLYPRKLITITYNDKTIESYE
jgi:hypothetical protein